MYKNICCRLCSRFCFFLGYWFEFCIRLPQLEVFLFVLPTHNMLNEHPICWISLNNSLYAFRFRMLSASDIFKSCFFSFSKQHTQLDGYFWDVFIFFSQFSTLVLKLCCKPDMFYILVNLRAFCIEFFFCKLGTQHVKGHCVKFM